MASVSWQIQEGLRLIFATFVGQLQDSILVQCNWQDRKRQLSQKQKTLDRLLDAFG